jgi:Flp pilus assembly protein TadG
MTVAQSDGLWARVLTSDLSLLCYGVMIVCVVGLALGVRLLRRVHRGRSAGHPLTDTDGTATIEFALVVPFLLFIMLVLTQTTLLMGGNIFVHYSAYAATRTAIVQIPAEYADDPANRYTAAPGRRKHDAIRRAAALAVVPVAGRQSSSETPVRADEFVAGLRQHYAAYGRDEPNWIENFAAKRMRYAIDHTQIIVYLTEAAPDEPSVHFREISEGSAYRFEARDAISVRVLHRLNLPVPYANRIFATGRHELGTGRYRLVTARYTMTNEGVRDEMPPTPTVPRRTP